MSSTSGFFGPRFFRTLVGTGEIIGVSSAGAATWNAAEDLGKGLDVTCSSDELGTMDTAVFVDMIFVGLVFRPKSGDAGMAHYVR